MKVFGIKAVVINDCVVHTYNIMVKKSQDNITIINQHGLKATTAGINNDRLKLTFTSLDVKEFNSEVNKLGKVLKEIAQSNLNIKYNWVR